jgi:hypothetical protein
VPVHRVEAAPAGAILLRNPSSSAPGIRKQVSSTCRTLAFKMDASAQQKATG